MPRKRNPGKAFTGTVKFAKAKIPKKFGCTPQQSKTKLEYPLEGGPLDGKVVRLHDPTATLPIQMGSFRGRYSHLRWVDES